MTTLLVGVACRIYNELKKNLTKKNQKVGNGKIITEIVYSFKKYTIHLLLKNETIWTPAISLDV